MIRVFVVGGPCAGQVVRLNEYNPYLRLRFPETVPLSVNVYLEEVSAGQEATYVEYQVYSFSVGGETFYLAGLSRMSVESIFEQLLTDMVELSTVRKVIHDKLGLTLDEFYHW